MVFGRHIKVIPNGLPISMRRNGASQDERQGGKEFYRVSERLQNCSDCANVVKVRMP